MRSFLILIGLLSTTPDGLVKEVVTPVKTGVQRMRNELKNWIPAPVPDPDPGFAGMTENTFSELLRSHHT